MRNSGGCCTKYIIDVRLCTLGLVGGQTCGAGRRPGEGKNGLGDCGFRLARGLAVGAVNFARWVG